MRKFISLALLISIFTGMVKAGVITPDEARLVAVNFFKVNSPQAKGAADVTATLNYTRAEADNSVDYYVFNMQPVKGFVIVAAYDNTRPVLAYSTESYFFSNLAKTGVVDWMNHAATHIVKVQRLGIAADDRIKNLWNAYRTGVNPATDKSTGVNPLLSTTWDQEPGYNAFCPYNSTDHQRCVTGCVATAMAQIMKFWNFPPQGVGSNSYDAYNYQYGVDYGNQSADFGNTIYDWAHMQNSIGANDTPIATLMYQCGVSVDMNYGDDNEDGSGAEVLAADAGGYAPSSQSAYTHNFSYNSNTIQGLYESSYDSSGWLSAIETELNAGRPVQYVGEDPSVGGHSWVCDGYDANNLVHMNWGWGGQSNGYYAVSDLDPSGFNFSDDEEVLIGIEPVRANAQITASVTSLCNGDSVTLQAEAGATSYSWLPATGVSCPTCQNTKAAPTSNTTYTLIIDSSGVQGNAIVTITVIASPSISNGNVDNASCYGAANGSAVVNVSGGTPGYTFLWSNGGNAWMDTGLIPGVYYVTATDAKGCQAVSYQVVGSNTPVITVSPTVTSAACKAANGSAVVSASGGPGGSYSYAWVNGSTTDEISDVPAGSYALTVTDGACSTVTEVQVPQQDQLNVQLATAPSNGQNGSATVESVSGGNGPFSYVWLGYGVTSQSISGLAPGAYPVVVTDANGCYDTVTAVVSVATGISPVNDALSAAVFPNPSKGAVVLRLSNLSANTWLKVENMLGQTLVSMPVTEVQTQLDLSSFSDGVYLFEIQHGAQKAVKQVVLSR